MTKKKILINLTWLLLLGIHLCFAASSQIIVNEPLRKIEFIIGTLQSLNLDIDKNLQNLSVSVPKNAISPVLINILNPQRNFSGKFYVTAKNNKDTSCEIDLS